MALDLISFKNALQSKIDNSSDFTASDFNLLSKSLDTLEDPIVISDIIEQGITEQAAINSLKATVLADIENEGNTQKAAVQALGDSQAYRFVQTDITDAQTVNGNLTINGNLTVQGTTINQGESSISDSIILLNSGVTGTPVSNSGIEIERGDEVNAQFYWDETSDTWTPGATASVTAQNFHGNADSADILSSARSIAISSGGTGSVSFDGSADVTLALTITDDSHSHDTRHALKEGSINQDFAADTFTVRKAAAEVKVYDITTAGAVSHTPDVTNYSVFHYNINGPTAVSIDLGSPNFLGIGRSIVVKVTMASAIPIGFPNTDFGTTGTPITHLVEHFYFVCIDGTTWAANRFHSKS
jgi:hypothetical protein